MSLVGTMSREESRVTRSGIDVEKTDGKDGIESNAWTDVMFAYPGRAVLSWDNFASRGTFFNVWRRI